MTSEALNDRRAVMHVREGLEWKIASIGLPVVENPSG